MNDIETGVVGWLARRLVAACAPREVVLFGSYAKGLADRCSDIDLLVILDSPASQTLTHATFDATRAAIGVDVHLYSAAELAAAAADPYGFLGSILRSGRTVYCRPGCSPIRSGILEKCLDAVVHPGVDCTCGRT